MEVGPKYDFALRTIGNAASTLTHEWGHVEMFGLRPPPFGASNPYYYHEIMATWTQITSPSFLLTTPEFRSDIFSNFISWAYPLYHGYSSLLVDPSFYSHYIYGPKE
jgi:hypothetical protein